jgi:hypothetical protein
MSLRLLVLWDPTRKTYGQYKKWLLDLLTQGPGATA